MLDEELIPAYEALPEADAFADLATVRAFSAVVSGAAVPSEGVTADDRTVTFDGRPLRLRVYTPAEARPGPRPAALWIHGGAFAYGAPNAEDAHCRRLCAELGLVVVAPDYRLAPEHPYPAGFDDCYDALRWLHAQAAELGVDPGRVAVGGHSSGGALALSVALAARDRGGPPIAYLYLGYPVLDDRQQTPSAAAGTDPRLWNRDSALAMWRNYLRGAEPEPGTGYAVPGRHRDLSGLPPAYVMAAALDPSRDEALELADRLIRAGVSVELHLVPRAPHTFDLLGPDAAVTRRAVASWTRALAQALQAR